MAIAIIELGETTLKTNWERIDFSVSLPDLKQPIIMANEGKYVWDSTTNNWGVSKTKKKFRLTGFDYKLDDDGVLSLSAITGNFFTKANRVGARESYVSRFDQETLDQIPDELHDFARERLAKELTPMLQKVIDTGLVVKPNA
jgi:hypothetical protein